MKPRHLTFSELIKLTQIEAKGNKKAHLEGCERCLAGYAVAIALVSKSKEGKEPIEIIIGDITSALRNLTDATEVSKREIVGKPDIIGVEIHVDAHGLNLKAVSGRYEVGHVNVKIYKRTKEAGQLIELKKGMTDKNGFIRMGHMDKESMDEPDHQYLISVRGMLKPLQKKAFIVPSTYNLS